MITDFPVRVRLNGSDLHGYIIGRSFIKDPNDPSINMVVVEWDNRTCSREPLNSKLVRIKSVGMG